MSFFPSRHPRLLPRRLGPPYWRFLGLSLPGTPTLESNFVSQRWGQQSSLAPGLTGCPPGLHLEPRRGGHGLELGDPKSEWANAALHFALQTFYEFAGGAFPRASTGVALPARTMAISRAPHRVCMHLCTYLWMDGRKEGCMHGTRDGASLSRPFFSCFFGPAIGKIDRSIDNQSTI